MTATTGAFRRVQVKGFIDTSFIDWPGKICSVVFLPYCNFRCPYCHNAELVLRPGTLRDIDWDWIMAYLDEHCGWIDGVCVSGGEPTLHADLREIFAELRHMGFLTKLDTNGSNPAMLEGLIGDGLLDYVAMDVKACLDETSYCRITGARGILAAVKRSIAVLKRGQVEYEFRMTVVPEYHQPAEILRLAGELTGAARLRIQNFFPSEAVLDPHLQQASAFSDDDIAALQQQVDRLLEGPPACH